MPVFVITLALFICMPLAELAVLLRIGTNIGVLPTIGLCLATAFVGAILVRLEGVQTLLRIQDQVRAGVLPAAEVLEGLALFVAGVMLLTPGFITDGIGFLALTPPLRRPLAAWLAARAIVIAPSEHDRPDGPDGASGEGDVYEAEAWEYEVRSEDDPARPRIERPAEGADTDRGQR
jgi:UPF0716 protein FxsA